MWTAFKLTPFNDVKVVILGQILSRTWTSTWIKFFGEAGRQDSAKFAEYVQGIAVDIGCPLPESGTLTGWAEQGVLMLNTVLTVREGQAHSHRKQGWETFTDEVIRRLSEREKPIVFILWGRPAQEKKKLIDISRHAIIESVHPSPLSASRGFSAAVRIRRRTDIGIVG